MKDKIREGDHRAREPCISPSLELKHVASPPSKGHHRTKKPQPVVRILDAGGEDSAFRDRWALPKIATNKKRTTLHKYR